MDVVRWLASKGPERTGGKQHPVLDFAQVTASFPLAYYAGGSPHPLPLDWGTTAPSGMSPEPSAPPFRHMLRFIHALSHLNDGDFKAVVSGMGYLWADVGSSDQRASAVNVYSRATRPGH